MQYLSELERGRKEASSEILAALCAALQLDLSELLAAAGHDLLDQRARPTGLLPLDALRDGHRLPARADGLADEPAPPFAPPVLPLAQPAIPAGGEPGSSARGSADVVCLLAA
jgi:transcriptional regulator with XRE-family HTH domain